MRIHHGYAGWLLHWSLAATVFRTPVIGGFDREMRLLGLSLGGEFLPHGSVEHRKQKGVVD